MKIRSLRLEHFRKFTDPVTLTGFADGVNVLAECNEFGKSTLLAAIRGVLFERHVSKAGTVREMQHWSNKTAPVISLEFELPTGLHKIEKRFITKPYALLTLPNGTIYQDEAAEEHLQRVLNFTQAGRSGSDSQSMGMWAALWVTQRESVDQPELTDSARQTIHGCLDQEVGALAGGTRGKKMLAGVRNELGKIRDGNRKPAGRYKVVVAEQVEAQKTLAALQARHQRLVKDIAELQGIKRQLADTITGGEEARTSQLLDEAHRRREDAQRFEDQERAAVDRRSLFANRVAAAEKEIEARKEHERTLLAVAERIATLTGTEAATKSELRRAEDALRRQRELLQSATTAYDRAGEALRKARTEVDLALMAATLEAFAARLLLADAAQARVNQLVARLASLTVTEPELNHLRELEKQLRKTEAVLEAQATHLTLTLLPEATSRIQLNGGLAETGTTSLIEDTVIAIDGIGEILIQPGIKDRDALLSRGQAEARLLREALQALACTTLEQAEERFAQRRHCEAELLQARQELTGHTPADPAHKMGPGVEALRNQVSVFQNQLAAGMSAAGLTALPDLSAAQETLRQAERTEREAAGAVGTARAPLAGLEAQHSESIRRHTQAESQRAAALEEQLRLTGDRDLRLQQESTEALAERLHSSREDLLAQQASIESLERSRPAESVATLDARMVRLGKALKDYAHDRQANEQRLAVLKNQIEREEGVGIEEQVDRAQHTADLLEREIERYRHETQVLELLLDTLVEAEHAAKERYMAPVIQRVTPYLQALFPGAAIHCDEHFQITGIIRELAQTESFPGLSVGTQEQIAVLTRLAFADMLLERGQPATVILDDALVYSDSERMERMFDLLAQAATQTQILILTCRADLFTRLGGHRLKLVTG